MRIHFFPDAKEKLLADRSVGLQMRAEAEKVAARVRAPSRFRISAKGGIASTTGKAFGQVIMAGPGAVVEEFGSKTRSPSAPLRRAARIL